MCLDLSRGQTKSFRKTPFDPIVLTFFCTEFIVSNENIFVHVIIRIIVCLTSRSKESQK